MQVFLENIDAETLIKVTPKRSMKTSDGRQERPPV